MLASPPEALCDTKTEGKNHVTSKYLGEITLPYSKITLPYSKITLPYYEIRMPYSTILQE